MASEPSDTARRHLPPERDLRTLRSAASGCTACPLHLSGTQTVFGDGPADAVLMLVGEQPGDAEDVAGEPFVGPAGKLLDRCLEAAGIDRRRVYVTNVVKHFKWVPRGKRRIHGKPNAREIRACLPWLEAEMEAVSPRVVVCLGATAAQALLGSSFRVSRQRGEFVASPIAPYVMATAHPSALLRQPDEDSRRVERARFIADLRKVAEVLVRPDVP
ncbi:MAG: UdgX family uracil-DNA binding protein [Rhodospirillales bacterium]|nr:UdgX family uracil-DNA binding protein [Rhodospirillales bacterium]